MKHHKNQEHLLQLFKVRYIILGTKDSSYLVYVGILSTLFSVGGYIIVTADSSALKPVREKKNISGNMEDEIDKLGPITSKHLLIWAYQVAKGLEYLGSMKVRYNRLSYISKY